MGISGNLETMALAELLQWLSMGQKTGTLVIDGSKVEKKIYFADGVIISSASTDPKEYLGSFLASHGFVPEEQVNAAVARQEEEKQLLGQVLVGMNAIAEEDLQQILRLKAEESIYDLFTWEKAEFKFYDGELPKENMVRMSLDVQWIILEGTRRIDEWNRLREWVPSPLCVPVSMVDLSALEVEEVELRILEWIDDDRTVEDISQECQTTLFQTAGAITKQVQAGTVKVVRPRTVEVEVRVEVPAASASTDRATVPLSREVVQQIAAVSAAMVPQQVAGQVAPRPAVDPAPSAVEMAGGRTLQFAGAASDSGVFPIAQPPAQQPPESNQSEAEERVEKAEEALGRGDLEQALVAFREAKAAEGADTLVDNAVQSGESKILRALEREGIRLSSVPKLKCGMDELTQLKISPQEGFMLTRVDGSYDIKSILKMSPMPAIDAQMLFWRLKKSGHVLV